MNFLISVVSIWLLPIQTHAVAPLDTFWMGAGFNSNSIHLGVYVAYRLEMLAVLSAFF